MMHDAASCEAAVNKSRLCFLCNHFEMLLQPEQSSTRIINEAVTTFRAEHQSHSEHGVMTINKMELEEVSHGTAVHHSTSSGSFRSWKWESNLLVVLQRLSLSVCISCPKMVKLQCVVVVVLSLLAMSNPSFGKCIFYL